MRTAFERFPGLRTSGGCVAVPCSTCNAAPGEPCQSGGMEAGLARWPHAARQRAARLAAWWTDFGMGSAEDLAP